jgi:hypothetical protein
MKKLEESPENMGNYKSFEEIKEAALKTPR